MHIDLRKSLFILPNLFTLSSIYCGFLAILLCIGTPTDAEHYRASLLILYAMFFDIIDGRVARMTKTQSAFGMQIDSLADVISFGVAPAVLVYTWSLHGSGPLASAAAFAYVACGAVRLARFNVLSTGNDGAPKKPDKYIVGLPIPGAAGVLVSLVAANHAVQGSLSERPKLIAVAMLTLAFFMVSTIKFRSFKDIKLNARTLSLFALAIGSSVILALQIHIAFACAWLLLSYLAIGLVESMVISARKLARRRSRSADEDDAAPVRRGR